MNAKPFAPPSRLPFAAAARICRRELQPFFFAGAFLPAKKRDAAYAVLAFCSMIDGAFDSGAPAEQTLELLNNRLDEIYQGRLELPKPEFRSDGQNVLEAVGDVIGRSQIPRTYFASLAGGWAASQAVRRYATWAALEKHCRATGGAISVILACALGVTHSQALQKAEELGAAMRLSEILRDLKIDAAHERIFLPLEDLVRFRYSQDDLLAGVASANSRELMAFEISRCRQLYEGGAAGICWLAGGGSRFMVAAAAVLKAGILSAIQRADFDVFSRPVRLSAAQQLRRIPAAWRLARRKDGQPIPPVFG